MFPNNEGSASGYPQPSLAAADRTPAYSTAVEVQASNYTFTHHRSWPELTGTATVPDRSVSCEHRPVPVGYRENRA
jgi:hypothetical protein